MCEHERFILSENEKLIYHIFYNFYNLLIIVIYYILLLSTIYYILLILHDIYDSLLYSYYVVQVLIIVRKMTNIPVRPHSSMKSWQ